MRNLFRRTSELFWQHPILWLPILIADFCKFLLTYFQTLITHQIAFAIVRGHRSVLGGAPDPPANPATAILKASLISAPFTWGTYFLGICLYVAAIFIVFKLVGDFVKDEKPTPSEIFSIIVHRKRSIFSLSIKALALFAMAAIMTAALASWIVGNQNSSAMQASIYLTALIFYSAIAWFLVPTIISTLCSPRLSEKQSIFNARLSSVLTVAVSLLIALFLQTAERASITRQPSQSELMRLIIEMTGSLLTAFPYVALSITLSLVAIEEKSVQG